MSGAPPARPDDDGDRTVIRPSPGGRAMRAPTAEQPAGPAVSLPPELCPVIDSKLGMAATPLLQLLARLNNTSRPPDPVALRTRVVQQLRDFDRRAREAGVTAEMLRPAHHALCASIDDVVLNTPWGGSSNWNGGTLVATFHRNAGEHEFFTTLRRIQQDPAKFMPLIELMYLCLSLGYMGPYRPPEGDAAAFEALRHEVCGVISRQRKGAIGDLSPRWRGVRAPFRATRRRLPVWVAATVAVAAIAVFFAWVSSDLNTVSDRIYARFAAAPPDHMPRILRVAYVQPPAPPPPAAVPDIMDRLREALRAEIGTGHVSVAGTASMPIVRIVDRGLFPAASASLQTAAIPLLDRIGSALKTEPGLVQVTGYTDNQPVHSVRFASNFQLSLARAQAVRMVIAGILGDPARVTADGRADADPIGSNATAEGRELNRRTEIVLHRQDPQD